MRPQRGFFIYLKKLRIRSDHTLDQSQKSPKTFLVTGSTGFLGSHITTDLLSAGHRVIVLARSRNGQSARTRVLRLMNWFGLDESEYRELSIFEGDLLRPGLGLDFETLKLLDTQVEETVHCASDTSFSSRRRKQVEDTNVLGLQNLFATLEKSRMRRFHLISTAYVAGRNKGLCREDFVYPSGFNNVYEETKLLAEHMAAEKCARSNINLLIYRPSIVYGDSTTGRTLLFNALYYPIKTLRFFQKLYLKDILESEGSKAEAIGVSLFEDGTLHLPVRIESTGSSRVNLIPVDHFIRAFMAIQEEKNQDGVFHIVNPENTAVQQLLEYTSRYFRLSGVRIAGTETFIKQPRNALELLFENYIRVYSSYMRDTRIFEHAKTTRFLASKNIRCPDFTYNVFSTCMRYAEEVDWGRR